MCTKLCNGFFTAVGMFSVLPVPKTQWNDSNTGLLIPMFPLVGAIIGALWYGAARLLQWWQPPLLLYAAFLCLIPMALSGFLHMDGYMDTADAVFSRRKMAEKQRILKDPHVGAFGVMALAVYLLLAFSAAGSITAQNAAALLFIPVLSRCLCGVFVLCAPLISQTGYAAMYRKNARPRQIIWLVSVAITCIAVCLYTGGTAALWPLFTLACCGTLVAWFLCRQLGGVSGDVSGCVLAVSELSALICMALQTGGLA